MNVNYDDERFTQVEQDRQNELNKYNQTYDNLIAERDKFTQQQQDYVDNWKTTQEQIANENLQHQVNLYNQEKEKAEKEFQKEANASYIDYLKQTSSQSVNREQLIQNGLSNGGYAETSRVSMYNTYQNRVAAARTSLNDIKIEFDNAIAEAHRSNNATLAELALQQMQQKLEIALEGFNYKDNATQNKLNWEYNINNNYYDRYKDVENQINYENEQAEAIRQYNEQMAYQKELDRIAQEQWEKEYAFQQQQLAYQKEQDAIANAQKWAQINAEKSYYATLNDSSSLNSGSDLSENSSSGSDTKLTNVKKSSPNLSSKNANNWYANNIDKLYFGGGLTESKLESIIDSGLSSGVINNKDVDKILSTFGL